MLKRKNLIRLIILLTDYVHDKVADFGKLAVYITADTHKIVFDCKQLLDNSNRWSWKRTKPNVNPEKQNLCAYIFIANTTIRIVWLTHTHTNTHDG